MKLKFLTIFLLSILASCSHDADVKKYYKPADRPKTVHFSIDDCSLIFRNLTENNYQSIFEEPVLGKLKNLHDKYGLKVSLYAFYDFGGFCLKDATDRYASQFRENSDWLRVAPHAFNGDILADNSVTYATMVENLKRITQNSITNTARLEKFQGGFDILTTDQTPLCLLTADSDTRKSYYLGDSLRSKMNGDEYYHDTLSNKFFYRTDFRLDNPDEFDSLLNANAADDCIVFFTHEWLLETKPRLNVFAMLQSYSKASKIFENLERVCMYVCMYEHDFKTDLDGKYYGK